MTIKELKFEIRTSPYSRWVSASGAWLQTVGHLYDRREPIPGKYFYKPSRGHLNPHSYWFNLLSRSSTDQLHAIAEFLYRYLILVSHFNYQCNEKI